MTAKWFELVTGPLEEKKQYRQAKARLKNLPAPYRAAAEAVERYLMVAGGIARGDVVVRMYVDLVDLFEQSAADGTPIRDVVGEDPVDFVDTFVASYGDGSWMNKERARLIQAIDDAERAERP